MQQLLLPLPGAISESIGNLVSLQVLSLWGNAITGKAVSLQNETCSNSSSPFQEPSQSPSATWSA